MDAYPTLSMDLPLKALIWESNPGKTSVGLTSPKLLQRRHGLPTPPFAEVIQLFTNLLGE
jgi:uncharacterized protein (DUF302 family)